MIKDTELRIGNTVYHHGQIDTIQGIDIERWDTFAHEYEPIPLTEEWLLKFGVEKINETKWKITEAITLSYPYDFNRWDVLEPLRNMNTGEWINNVNTGSGIRIISYVHQLQNLWFALHGQELEVKEQTTWDIIKPLYNEHEDKKYADQFTKFDSKQYKPGHIKKRGDHIWEVMQEDGTWKGIIEPKT